jgi:hypothetical protein
VNGVATILVPLAQDGAIAVNDTQRVLFEESRDFGVEVLVAADCLLGVESGGNEFALVDVERL